jgi:hypothetical protein
VLGKYDFGVDLEYMVFNTKYAANQILEKVDEQINSYVYHTNNVSINCDINFGDSGRGYDYAVLDIYNDRFAALNDGEISLSDFINRIGEK